MKGALRCGLDQRRKQVRQARLLGLDYVEVDATQTRLEVFFLGRAPSNLTQANIAITGGSPVRVVSIRVYPQRDETLDDWMEVDVDGPGDFSTYTLSMVQPGPTGTPVPMAGFDPLYDSVSFTFKASCPTSADCAAPQVCPPPTRTAPPIDYLAKDYASFRQLILDRLAQTMPGWTETHLPDIGVMLVDLLAYVGDQLSYYQDAVATEAYLGTARQRISLRRHARLVDYRVHEGCNARAWITIAAAADYTLDLRGVLFCTSFPGAPAPGILQPADFAKAPAGSYTVFEALMSDSTRTITLRQAHNEIRFYTWGDCACCLPSGTTSATLADFAPGETARVLNLNPGDILIFEEVIGPHTGNPADADPTHRQAVRLTVVKKDVDPLFNRDAGGLPVLRITWCAEDALAFPLCLSALMPVPDCTCRDGVSVARGNVLLVDQGLSTTETLGTVPIESSTPTCATDCAPSTVVLTAGPFRPTLTQRPLTHAQPLPSCICATPVITQNVRQALPSITLTGTVAGPSGAAVTTWAPLADLLESGPDDAAFVVETDDSGIAHLRFGNGDEGRQPDAGTAFTASYRIGNGPSGNIGRDTITYIVFPTLTEGTGALLPRNPLAAAGGTAPEKAADVRMVAPYGFRDVLERAVTAADYATLASDNARRLAERERLERTSTQTPVLPRQAQEEEPGEPAPLPADLCLIPFEPLQNALGTLCWNGSWYEARVAVDPMGTETADTELLAEVDAYLARYRRIGHDLSVTPASYVSLDLGLSVCVKPLYLQAQVAALLRQLLGTGVLPDGTLARFNPDRLTFGQAVYLGPIIAAAQSVPGVLEVQVTRLARLVPGRPPPQRKPDSVPANGMLALSPSEIARLDQNPNAPGNGRLTLLLRGGR
jgi:hypothetical protein